MAACAICPAYATGIFVIGNGDAAGAGFAIDRFMRTEVRARRAGATAIFIGGRKASAPVSRAVVQGFARRGFSLPSLEVRHSPGVPVGFGLGMSAAGALSLSLALNEEVGAGLPRGECVKIAHDADVECGCGLSGADAAAVGGMLARRSLGEGTRRLPFEERSLQLAFFSPISTASVIGSPAWKRKVNAAGRRALGALFSDLTWGGFVGASREFALASGLAKWCEGEMKANPRACMAMVGRTLFSDAPLSLRRKPLMLLGAKTHGGGAELL